MTGLLASDLTYSNILNPAAGGILFKSQVMSLLYSKPASGEVVNSGWNRECVTSLGHYIAPEKEVLKGSWACVKKIIVVIVYNIWNKEDNPQSCGESKNKSGRWWEERMSTNAFCNSQRNH